MLYTNENIKKKLNNKEKRRKILKIIIAPFIIAFLILISYIGYLKYIKKTNDINLFGYRQYMVLTGSMEPNYNIGDLIVIKEKPQEDIKVGDIVNYVTDNGKDTITHRVIEIVEQNGQIMYKTKGDNNSSSDPNLVNYSQIQGTIVFKINKLGAIITEFLTGVGIFVIAMLIVISYIHSSRKEEKRIAREDARRLYNIPKYEKEENV